jgi:hypothetical protein
VSRREDRQVGVGGAVASEQLVQRDRQVPHPLAGRVMDGVRRGRTDTGDPHLAGAEDAEWHVRVRVVQEGHVDLGCGRDTGGNGHFVGR